VTDVNNTPQPDETDDRSVPEASADPDVTFDSVGEAFAAFTDGPDAVDETAPPQYGVGPFSIREAALGGAWVIAFIVSFFPIYSVGSSSVWTAGIDWVLTIGVPTVVVADRDEPDPGHPLAVGEAYAATIPRARLLVEEPCSSPLAWQGGRLSAVIAELAQSVPTVGVASGVPIEVYDHVKLCTDRLAQIRAARVIVAKLAEVLVESEAKYEHERENDLSLMADAVRSRAHRKRDSSLLAGFQETLKYCAQTAEKAAKTRKKNAAAKKKAGSQSGPGNPG